MTAPKKPCHSDGAPSGANDLSDVHTDILSAKPTPDVNSEFSPDDGSSDAIDKPSGNMPSMVQGPRQSHRVKKRGPFGQRLRELRLARDITQMELAVEIGTSRSHVASLETGADTPGRETLHALATFFGVTMDFLQSGIADTPKNGRFVQDADQLALLALWDLIPASERPRIARMLRAAAFDRAD